MPEKHGVASPFTAYVKFLPLELLPTFWHDRERCLLKGTTLEAAVQAKLKSLYREFELLRASTSGIQWCADCWWNEVDGQVTFDDWLHIDAMYRSRALEFPGIGACMAPCIDMANHASGEDTAAIYEVDEDGNAVLLLRPGRAPQPGDEITITYGDEKGACEMIFSYGFIEDSMTNAKELFLDLTIPADDPLGRAKNAAANSAPGFKIFDIRDGIDWTGNFIWLLCVNEEDGLEFAIRRTVEGERELGILWKGQEMPHLDNFRAILEQDPMWEVFHLRAVSLLQDRVAIQLQTLYESEDEIQALARNEQLTFRDRTRQLALRLRSLETNMLERAYGHFEDMVSPPGEVGQSRRVAKLVTFRRHNWHKQVLSCSTSLAQQLQTETRMTSRDMPRCQQSQPVVGRPSSVSPMICGRFVVMHTQTCTCYRDLHNPYGPDCELD